MKLLGQKGARQIEMFVTRGGSCARWLGGGSYRALVGFKAFDLGRLMDVCRRTRWRLRRRIHVQLARPLARARAQVSAAPACDTGTQCHAHPHQSPLFAACTYIISGRPFHRGHGYTAIRFNAKVKLVSSVIACPSIVFLLLGQSSNQSTGSSDNRIYTCFMPA